MQDGAALLYPAVMAAADDLAVMNQHRADGDTAFSQALAGFFDGSLKKGIHGWRVCSGYLGTAM